MERLSFLNAQLWLWPISYNTEWPLKGHYSDDDDNNSTAMESISLLNSNSDNYATCCFTSTTNPSRFCAFNLSTKHLDQTQFTFDIMILKHPSKENASALYIKLDNEHIFAVDHREIQAIHRPDTSSTNLPAFGTLAFKTITLRFWLNNTASSEVVINNAFDIMAKNLSSNLAVHKISLNSEKTKILSSSSRNKVITVSAFVHTVKKILDDEELFAKFHALCEEYQILSSSEGDLGSTLLSDVLGNTNLALFMNAVSQKLPEARSVCFELCFGLGHFNSYDKLNSWDSYLTETRKELGYESDYRVEENLWLDSINTCNIRSRNCPALFTNAIISKAERDSNLRRIEENRCKMLKIQNSSIAHFFPSTLRTPSSDRELNSIWLLRKIRGGRKELVTQEVDLKSLPVK